MKDSFDEGRGLEVTEELMESIYCEEIKKDETLTLDFVFITDSETKTNRFKEHLEQSLSNLFDIKIERFEEYWIINYSSIASVINAASINIQVNHLWHQSYLFDCRLEGWKIKPNN